MSTDVSMPDRLVVLTFDDAVSNHASFVAPILKRYGFGATFYICEMAGDGGDCFEKDKRQYMTWEQIATLDRMGFEIGNHTGHHIAVRNLPREKLIEEIEFIEQRCAAHNIRPPETFCYPGGVEDPGAFPVLREKGYHLARGCGNRPYRADCDNPLLVPSYVITGNEEAGFPDIVSQAGNGKMVVLTFHGVPDYNHSWVDTPPEIFERMMRHLSDIRATVIAMREIPRFAGAALNPR